MTDNLSYRESEVLRFKKSQARSAVEQKARADELNASLQKQGLTPDYQPLEQGEKVKKKRKKSIPRVVGPGDSENSDVQTATSVTSSKFGDVNWARGIQAFDMAQNPREEHVIYTRAGERSIKHFETDVDEKYGANSLSTKKTLSQPPRAQSCYTPSKSEKTSGITSRLDTDAHSGSSIVVTVEENPIEECDIAKFQFLKACNKQAEVMAAVKCVELPWLEQCLEEGPRACRFDLPMDMLELQPLTTVEYLLKFCRVPNARALIYLKQLERCLGTTVERPPGLVLEESLMTILHGWVDKQEIKSLIEFLKVSEAKLVQKKTFVVLAAFAERVLYAGFASIKQLKKYLDPRSHLEQADFSGILNKMEGVRFQHDNLRVLLLSLV